MNEITNTASLSTSFYLANIANNSDIEQEKSLDLEQVAALGKRLQPAMFEDLLTNVEEIRPTAMAQASTAEQASTEQEDWVKAADEECTIIPGESYSQPRYLIRSCGVGSIPRGDIAAIKAKSKNGKSFLATIFASVILGARFGNIEPTETDTRVLYFDTEQSKSNVANVQNRISELCGWEKSRRERLAVFALRKLNLERRWQYIRKKIEQRKPDAVVIDGIADLIRDFNNVEESRTIIEEVSQAAEEFNCTIIFVLHTNKAKDDTNMKGHLGSVAVQKCSDVFEVGKDKCTAGLFNVKESENRNAEFPAFSFTLDADIVPRPMQTTTPQTAAEKKRQELLDIFTPLFADKKCQPYATLKDAIMHAKGCTKSNADKLRKFAIDEAKILVKNADGTYSLSVKV